MYATRYRNRRVAAPTLAGLFEQLRRLAAGTACVAGFISLDAVGQYLTK